MDGAHFQKLCRDCGLLDRHTGPTEVDLVFTYVSVLLLVQLWMNAVHCTVQ